MPFPTTIIGYTISLHLPLIIAATHVTTSLNTELQELNIVITMLLYAYKEFIVPTTRSRKAEILMPLFRSIILILDPRSIGIEPHRSYTITRNPYLYIPSNSIS